jgi:hypothetical protein
MNKNSIEEAIKIMEHWIEYEKNNKEKINKAEELINIQETILSEYKRVLKENEELLQEKIDNQKINLLAQNFMLDYQKGYEDGKANRGSAVQFIIDEQQYYIFRKQIGKYKEHIEKLQKENEELNEKILDNAGIYQLGFKDGEESYNKKVKDKIRKNEEVIDISNDGDLIHELYQKNKVYEELLESEE